MEEWKNGCVAILKKDKDEPSGTGFVVHSTGIIVTCSHCLRPQDDGTISVRFTANGQKKSATVIEQWSRTSSEEDISFLRLVDPLPVGIRPLRLTSSYFTLDFHSWGYPSITNYNGETTTGTITGRTHKERHLRLQFSSQRITNGYSGGPLWDDKLEAVIGVVNEGFNSLEMGFATPSETLIHLCPELELITDVLTAKKRLIEPYQRIPHQLPPGYSTAFSNFLTEYLGTGNKKVPFGGREIDLKALDAWRRDEHSPSYALLVAEAGQGKSALLVDWAVQLTTRDEAEVIFIPGGIPFGNNSQTNFFATLTARLNDLHGSKPLGDYSVHSSAEMYSWRSYALLEKKLPDGKQLLIILDGLDEVSDWQPGPRWFPSQLPPGIKLIASARSNEDKDEQGWLKELRWQKNSVKISNLALLSYQGVSDILRQMNYPLDTLAEESDVVNTLYKVSQGYPLLVRILIDQLVEQIDETANIQKLITWLKRVKPGLEGYFEGWWSNQRQLWGSKDDPREKIAKNFLTVLAVAEGPLSQADVQFLLPIMYNPTLEETVEILRRFVVCRKDETTHQLSFTFSYPQLVYHFKDQLDPLEKQEWEHRFLDYGHTTVAALHRGEIKSNEVPPYVIRFYVKHLEENKVEDTAFNALVCQEWAEAWFNLEGTYAGFLNDIQKIRKRAVDRHDIEMIIWCDLCQSSSIALSSNIPVNLLVEAVKQKKLNPHQALFIVRQKSLTSQRVATLRNLIPNLPPDLLPEVLNIIKGISDDAQRADALCDLAPRLNSNTDLQFEAIFTAKSIADEASRSHALTEIFPYLSKDLQAKVFFINRTISDEIVRESFLSSLAPHISPDLHTDVLTATKEITNESSRASVLRALVPKLSPDLRVEALMIAQNMTDEAPKAATLGALAPYLPPEQQTQVWRDTLKTTQKIISETTRSEFLSDFAPQLPADLYPEALTVAHSIVSEESRIAALTALAPYQAQVWLEALQSACNIATEKPRATALNLLVSHLPLEMLSKTLMTTYDIVDEGVRFTVFNTLIKRLQTNPSSDLLLLMEVLIATQNLSDKGLRVQALSKWIPSLPQEQQVRVSTQSLTVVWRIVDEQSRVAALNTLIPTLASALLTDALTLIQNITDEELRASALGILAQRLPLDLVFEAFVTIQNITDEGPRAYAISSLVPHLPPDLLHKAITITRLITNEGSRADILNALPLGLHPNLLDEALSIAQLIADEDSRASTLSTLVSHLLPEKQVQVWREVLTIVQNIATERSRIVMRTIVPELPEELFIEALNIARNTGNEITRANALVDLAPYIPTNLLLIEVLNVVQSISNESTRIITLVDLVSHLPENLLPTALTVIKNILDKNTYSPVLITPVPSLSTDLLTEVLDTAENIADEIPRTRLLNTLVPCLEASLLRRAFNVAQKTTDEWLLANTLSVFASRPTPDLFAEILNIIGNINNESARAFSLESIVSHLPMNLQADALTINHSIVNEDLRTSPFISLVPHLATDLLEESLTFACNFKAESLRASALSVLATRLSSSPDLLMKALTEAQKIKDKVSRVSALSSFIRYLPIEQQSQVINEAKSIISNIISDSPHAQTLIDLAPFLSMTNMLNDALTKAEKIINQDSEASAIRALIPYLYSDLKGVLDIAQKIDNERLRVTILKDLSSHLSPELLGQAFDVASNITNSRDRAIALNALSLSPHFAAFMQQNADSAYTIWLDTVTKLGDFPRRDFFKDLQILLPFTLALVNEAEQSNLAQRIAHAIIAVGRWWP